MVPCNQIKMLGYADDTSFTIADETSIIESFKILKQFELATGFILNDNKTKIFIIGQWADRIHWPVGNIHISGDSICILGITFMNDFNTAVSATWSSVIQKITKQVSLFQARKVNLFQRSIIVYTLVQSKVWYISQTYPLSEKVAKSITKIAFPYI